MNINMSIYLVDHESERIDYDSKSLPIFEVNRVQAEYLSGKETLFSSEK